MSKKKEAGKSMVLWEQELANLAKESAKNIKVSEGKFLSFQGGKMSYAGATVPDNELRCVILAWCYHNAYYDPKIPYNPKNPQSPICYAFSTDEDDMEPHSKSPDVQNVNCMSCPFNQFESARTGRGKACKNSIRLALICEEDLDDIDNAEIIYASIPPKSIKNWLVYVKQLSEKFKRPVWAAVTLLSRVPDDESQFKITFSMEELVSDPKLFPPLKDIAASTADGIDFPYVVRNDEVVEKKQSKFAKKR